MDYGKNFKAWLENEEDDYAIANRYFSVGHGDFNDEEGFAPKYVVWVYLNGQVQATEEGDETTYGSEWGHSSCDKTFKGRFEPETMRISIVRPCEYDWRKGDVNTFMKYELMPKLEKTFGKGLRPEIF